jgi:hypothetical protein
MLTVMASMISAASATPVFRIIDRFLLIPAYRVLGRA